MTDLEQPSTAGATDHRPRRRLVIAAGVALCVLTVTSLTTLVMLGRRTIVRPLAGVAGGAPVSDDDARSRQAARGLASLRPRGIHIVIDTYGNRLRVFDGDRLLREAVCSTGSGTVLIDPSGRRRWTFDTPLGERRVERKVRDPVWSKPDWAFIEEGYQPPTDPSLRVDRVSLGDYALYLGHGYIIHGTLFQTLLGQGVTHGCVRLGDQDLEYVYRTVPVGTRVYLY